MKVGDIVKVNTTKYWECFEFHPFFHCKNEIKKLKLEWNACPYGLVIRVSGGDIIEVYMQTSEKTVIFKEMELEHLEVISESR